MEKNIDIIEERLSRIETLLHALNHSQSEGLSSLSKSRRVTRKYLKEAFSVSYPTIHKLMNSGELPYVKAGRKTLFKLEDVEKYFESNRGGLR
jgi:excisionase family DNA binding protein